MAVLSAAALLPNRASAFWPFSTNADAATPALVPSSSTPTLRAPINRNPNSSAPIALAISGGSALVSYNGPDGTPADIASAIPPGRISVHEVSAGETLSDIADMFGVSINTIIWANNLSGPKDIHPGDILIILPVSGIERTVVKGDTLKSLALKYGGADATTLVQSIDEIAKFNGLDPLAPLVIGSIVIIPGGEVAPAAPSVKKSVPGREPYRGGSGSAQPGYYENPLPGAILTQGVHGWNAVDLSTARGTPIHAAADGMVIVARNNGAWNGGYGNYVVITHDNGTQTLYAHMKNAIVSFEQSVSSGEVIGYEGSTGESTGPHLHFEVRGAANPFHNCRVGSVCSPQ